jgi:hypothetical protein
MPNIKKKFEELGKEFNLSKQYPKYFNKLVFRSGVILCLFLLFFIFVNNNFSLNYVYAECYEDICQNPFYKCPQDSNSIYGPQFQCIEEVPHLLSDICSSGVCERKYLYKGEVLGEKPPFYAQYFNLICIIIMLSSIAVNHLIYVSRGKK